RVRNGGPYPFLDTTRSLLSEWLEIHRQGGEKMCRSHFIQSSCGCKREMKFVRCAERLAEGTNTKCRRIEKRRAEDSPDYCSRHLVYVDAPKKFYDRDGSVAEEAEEEAEEEEEEEEEEKWEGGGRGG
ncbi:hypothetical protein KC328_g18225, partial [Hortaea werneckii]